ncbi:unnamed protein product [Paramecium sonneborni]|uniref:Uncharacterized protein n=1 Tax=Paramecium sonneborni TaxID=65129 RepID=A0A8S1RLV7_9CILI|nr:unnamed protein product [Paramecium sonneborni]
MFINYLLSLDFTTRFEIFRDASILKANASQKKIYSFVLIILMELILSNQKMYRLQVTFYIQDYKVKQRKKYWDFDGDQEIFKEIQQVFLIAERIEDGQQMAIKAFSKSVLKIKIQIQ